MKTKQYVLLKVGSQVVAFCRETRLRPRRVSTDCPDGYYESNEPSLGSQAKLIAHKATFDANEYVDGWGDASRFIKDMLSDHVVGKLSDAMASLKDATHQVDCLQQVLSDKEPK